MKGRAVTKPKRVDAYLLGQEVQRLGKKIKGCQDPLVHRQFGYAEGAVATIDASWAIGTRSTRLRAAEEAVEKLRAMAKAYDEAARCPGCEGSGKCSRCNGLGKTKHATLFADVDLGFGGCCHCRGFDIDTGHGDGKCGWCGGSGKRIVLPPAAPKAPEEPGRAEGSVR